MDSEKEKRLRGRVKRNSREKEEESAGKRREEIERRNREEEGWSKRGQRGCNMGEEGLERE